VKSAVQSVSLFPQKKNIPLFRIPEGRECATFKSDNKVYY